MPVKILNTESFADLRQRGGYYVDKTDFLEQFLGTYGSATLFTRPRRFGKTMFMSMLADFFDITKDSRDLFAGLKVSENEALCREWMNQYPVIFLSLKGINGKDFPEALARIRNVVRDTCKKLEYLQESAKIFKADRERLIAINDRKADDSELTTDLATLTSALTAYHGKPAIVLIDEYDVPVANAWKKGYYEDMIDFMRDFLGNGLKTNFSLKFGILTGCLHITRESPFTGLNHFECYGVGDQDYADTFGFTGAEVDTLLAKTGLSHRKDIIREWYDGYCFGETGDIYCPWSILNYVGDLQTSPTKSPEAYWVHTSANELTRGFVTRLSSGDVSEGNRSLGNPAARVMQKTFEASLYKMTQLLEGKSIAVSLNKTPNHATLFRKTDNFWTLLYMTGYLTRTHDATNCVDSSDEKKALLVIPNKEIQEAFREEIATWLDDLLSEEDRQEFFKAFWGPDAKHCEKLLSDILLQIASCYDTQTRAGEERRESVFHGLLMGIFSLSRHGVLSNREEGKGRYDLSVTDRRHSRAAILEIKRTRTVRELDSAVEAGLEQISAQDYDYRLRKEGYRIILHWSLAFCRKQCRARVRLAELQ